MKRAFLPLLIALSLTAAAPAAFAGHHDHDRKEHRDRKKNKKHHNKHNEKEHKYYRHHKEHKKHHSDHRRYYRPVPPPGLGHLVRHACRGGRNLHVWEIGPGVYMLRYLLGNAWYMQEVYPARNACGRRFRVYDEGDYWYNDDGYRYYDRGAGLSIYFDGRDLYGGSVKPRINLNINL